MKENLPDNIDNFFADNLKDYGEEPGYQSWVEIDKRLSEIEKKKKGLRALTILSAAIIIAACLLLPFLLINPHPQLNQSAEKKLANKKLINNTNLHHNSLSEISAYVKNTNNISGAQKNEQVINLHHQQYEPDFSIAEIPGLNNPYGLNIEINHEKIKNLTAQNFFTNNLMLQNNLASEKTKSTIIKIPKQHNISISPFFSFDHISGRFIEQYEFDNADKSDYQQRENADMSFTGGVLAAYQLNNKFFLLSGVSISGSKLSISSTAVSALKDENGVYKFKLATSYGFAEISKSGIIPTAGDSLLISDAVMKFNYITFPVLIKYNLSNKKVKLSVHGGIALNKLMSEKVEAEYNAQNGNEVETINKIEGIRRIFFTVNTGIEASYNLNNHVGISVSPELRYGINSINKGTPVKTYPINYGLAIHFNMKL